MEKCVNQWNVSPARTMSWMNASVHIEVVIVIAIAIVFIDDCLRKVLIESRWNLFFHIFTFLYFLPSSCVIDVILGNVRANKCPIKNWNPGPDSFQHASQLDLNLCWFISKSFCYELRAKNRARMMKLGWCINFLNDICPKE